MFSGNNFLPPARIWISDDESVRVFMAAGAAEVAEVRSASAPSARSPNRLCCTHSELKEAPQHDARKARTTSSSGRLGVILDLCGASPGGSSLRHGRRIISRGRALLHPPGRPLPVELRFRREDHLRG